MDVWDYSGKCCNCYECFIGFQMGQPRIWMSMRAVMVVAKEIFESTLNLKAPSYATVVTGLL
jgi:hypothetical protein